MTVKTYLQKKQNPEIAINEAIKEIQDKADAIIEKAVSERFSVLEKQLKDITGMDLVDKITRNVLKDVKGEKGDTIKGDKGDEGDKGERGNSIQGEQGLQGEKGDKGDRGDKGKIGFTGIGIDGKDGQNGKDGSPDKPEDISKKLNTLEEKVEMKVIKGLKDYLKKLETTLFYKKSGGGGGGMGNVMAETPTGTVNGINDTFTLTTIPKTNALLLFVNGQFQRKTSEYTLSGKTITFNAGSIPQGGEIYAWFVR